MRASAVCIVHFVGAGPGDAELITVKGARLLREADVVVYAGSLVDRELVRTYAPDAEVHDSAAMTLEETTQVLAQAVADGKRAVRLHTGDPSIYGAIQEQMAELDALGIAYAVVPGVTSAFAAAATLKQELTLPEVSQTVIITRLAGRTPVPERESLAEIAKLGATLVIYLSVSMIDRVVAELLQEAYTPATPAAVVARASWPDEEVVEGTLADIAAKVKEAGIGKQALIIVGDVLKARREGLKSRSLLYDKGFSHEFRKGIVT
ncbi:precorrin-4 C(11)-methyltransferase [Geobacter sp.]|uniref:precorrin-4 C(11)-methyltransferase n=1 Tax=Geobacter sp. TaxID=46610 RepID=UPI0026387CE0|nr:precorrin-4 C(11)-methyltransferase [Geobacter sp.]